MNAALQWYKGEMEAELAELLGYWQTYTVDENYGGFAGQVDAKNIVHPFAPKGAVLNARILWAFSAAYRQTGNNDYIEMANRAFQYLSAYFIDKNNGGLFWSVDFKGQPLDTKKQVYAISFGIYALAEYYMCNLIPSAKDLAIDLFKVVIKYGYDTEYGGFIEALTADWKPIEDQRLSEKDDNTPKSMNTHLHVLEAFTNLYRIWPDAHLAFHIKELLNNFDSHIINKQQQTMHLFFENDWTVKGDIVSFGHDVEAAWLLLEAAEVLEIEDLIDRTKNTSVQMAAAAAKGLDADGGLWYEAADNFKHWIYEKHSWPQAEGMVGFFNAWQISGNEVFLEQSIGCWNFVKKYLKDPLGEWHWGIYGNGTMMDKDKAGFWKCPYHTSRACMEIITRINKLQKN